MKNLYLLQRAPETAYRFEVLDAVIAAADETEALHIARNELSSEILEIPGSIWDECRITHIGVYNKDYSEVVLASEFVED